MFVIVTRVDPTHHIFALAFLKTYTKCDRSCTLKNINRSFIGCSISV